MILVMMMTMFSYWDDHNDELLDICKTEIDGFTAELVRNNCNSSLFQVTR